MAKLEEQRETTKAVVLGALEAKQDMQSIIDSHISLLIAAGRKKGLNNEEIHTMVMNDPYKDALIKHMVHIEMLSPPPSMVLTKEEYENLVHVDSKLEEEK